MCGRKGLTKVTLVQWMIQPDLHNYVTGGLYYDASSTDSPACNWSLNDIILASIH